MCIYTGQELHNLCSVELIGTSIKSYADGSEESQRLVTFALGGTAGIHVYTYDILSAICVSTMFLAPELPSFINHVTILCKGASDANYTAPLEARKVLVASTDDGFLLSWNVDRVQETSEIKYKTNLSGLKCKKRSSVYDSHILKPASAKKNLVPPTGLWKAHNETITGLTTLDYYGCTVSVSNDGFVRVWTMHEVSPTLAKNIYYFSH